MLHTFYPLSNKNRLLCTCPSRIIILLFKIYYKEILQMPGWIGWLSVQLLTSAPVMTLQSWDRAPCQAPCSASFNLWKKLNAVNTIKPLTVYSSCSGAELDTVDSQKEEGCRTPFLQRGCFQVQTNGSYSTVFILKHFCCSSFIPQTVICPKQHKKRQQKT